MVGRQAQQLEGHGEKSPPLGLHVHKSSDVIPGSEVCASPSSLNSPGSGTLALAPTQGYGKHEYSRHPLWEQSSDLGC